jgi:hypothetical protein
VIVLENGEITEAGKLKELLQGQNYISTLGLTLGSTIGEQVPSTHGLIHENSSKTHHAPVEQVDEPSPDTRRKNGDFSVYKYYVTSSGNSVVMANIVFMFVWISFTEFSSQSTKLLPKP